MAPKVASEFPSVVPVNSRGLCRFCCNAFNMKSLINLAQDGYIVHSPVWSFRKRPQCRLCSFIREHSDMYLNKRPVLLRNLEADFARRHRRDGRGRHGRRRPRGPPFVLERCNVCFRKTRGSPRHTCMTEEEYTHGQLTELFLFLQDDMGALHLFDDAPFKVMACADSPWAERLPLRLVEWPIYGWTDRLAAAMRQKIAICESTHSSCGNGEALPMPTRLLRITRRAGTRGGLYVQLHITSPGERGRYAALSYCWGGDQVLKLTASSFGYLQEGIDAAMLPQTLEDAITVTESLGIQYLWVDALCIFQDAHEDKMSEIGRMGQVYENSTVTIAAATSRSVHEGFLRPQEASQLTKIDIEVPVVGYDEHGRRVVSGRSCVTLVVGQEYNIQELPLQKRGWAYQEHILPQRSLIFGELEPLLLCRSGAMEPKEPSHISYEGTSIIQFLFRLLYGDLVNVTNMAARRVDMVETLVNEYTSRKLTMPEDRQNAVDAVCRFIDRQLDDPSSFGIWQSCAAVCLQWRTVGLWKKGSNATLPDVPSWSWMSVTGPVTITYKEQLTDKAPVRVRLDGAKLHLESTVIPSGDRRLQVYSIRYDVGPKSVDLRLDEVSSEQERDITGVSFIPLARNAHTSLWAALMAVPEGSCFRRVGISGIIYSWSLPLVEWITIV